MNSLRRHITHIIPTLSFGGAEKFVVELINHSDPTRFRFSIITFSDNVPLLSQIIVPGVEIKMLSKSGQLSWHLFKDIERALVELAPDVVHTHLFGGDVWGRVAARRLHLPVVTTEHNINRSEGMTKTIVKRWLRDYSNVFTCPSQAVAVDMIKRYRVAEVAVIQHGIELRQFDSLEPLHIPAVPRLLMLGRLTEQKGQVVALAALAQLRDMSWTLDIVGSGEDEEKLRRLVTAYNLIDRVHIQPATTDVISVLNTHDVVLVPSLWEGLGLVVMEAMAAGRVVVASKVGGIPEIVQDTVTGYLVAPGDADALAAKLTWVLEHGSVVGVIAAAARDYAHTHFAIDRMIAAYEEIYSRVV